MDTKQSLDDILREIQRDSTPFPQMESAGAAGWETPVSAGASDLDTHLTLRPVAAPPTYVPEAVAARPEVNVADTAHLLSSGLTERQRRLPKLDVRLVGGLAAMLILVIGVGSATLLTQQSQELRQRAYEAPAVITPIPQFQAEPSETPALTPSPAPAPSSALPPVVLGVAAFIGLIVVAGLLFWAFVV